MDKENSNIIYVAKNGNDAWSRKYPEIAVYIRKGRYQFYKPVEFKPEEKPIFDFGIKING